MPGFTEIKGAKCLSPGAAQGVLVLLDFHLRDSYYE